MVTVETGRITGELSFATVPGVLPQIGKLLSAGTLDLSGVTRADSAGVALLLELRRRHGRPLPITALSPQLSSLVEFFHLGTVLAQPTAEPA